jgi:hypothetical protein
VLIAYLTTDDVNLDLADRLALECGAILYPQTFRERPPDGAFEGVLYDWDHLCSQWRQQLLAELLARPAACPVALHGYAVEEEHGEALRRHGVGVFRRLERGVFLYLRRAAGRARGNPSDGQADGLNLASEQYFLTVSP